MLTLDLLYAVMLGLPSKDLHHLNETAWRVLCSRIERFLASGHDPLTALKLALETAGDWERTELRKALQQVLPVMSIPGLSYRQRQALIALRYVKTASLTQLAYTLMTDRSNTHRRLQALVRRGLAIKFSQPGGVRYMAVTTPLPKHVKLGVQQLLDELLQDVATDQSSVAATTPTTSTTVTKATTTT